MTCDSWLDMLCGGVVHSDYARGAWCQEEEGIIEQTRTCVRSILGRTSSTLQLIDCLLLTYRGPAFSLLQTRFSSSTRSFFFQCTMTAWTGVGLHAKDFSLGPFDVSVGCSYSAPFAFTAKMDTAYTTRMDCNDSYTRTFFRRGACWNE